MKLNFAIYCKVCLVSGRGTGDLNMKLLCKVLCLEVTINPLGNIVQGEERGVEKEEKLVSARNEENTNRKQDTSSSTPVTKTIPVTKLTKLTLRHTYKEGKCENVFVRLEICTK
jgi:hypothetical protein